MFGLKFDNKSSALQKRNRIDRLVTAFKLDTPGSRPRNETKKEREGRQNEGMKNFVEWVAKTCGINNKRCGWRVSEGAGWLVV